ncbi:MAG TPA: zinc-binding alcohol dehydrogenase, partial [Chloroflexota bacterium]|nr:zinc-binding alcohol dehydrogenase [Chloroflexota bacterium]
MRQVVATNNGEVCVREAPRPVLEGSGAVVQTICSVFGEGSELGGLRRTRQTARDRESAKPAARTERPMSYQSCGRIVELSDDLRETLAVGDLVACAGGGFAAHAEYGYVPRHAMAKVPDGVSAEEAATTNIALTALHALRRAQFQPGEALAIIGLGMVGQCLAQLTAATGGRALATDRYPLRLEIARACGIEAAIDAASGEFLDEVRRRTSGLGADTVAICVGGGSSDLMHLAVRLVRPSGVVLIVGGPLLPDFNGATGDASPHLKEI